MKNLYKSFRAVSFVIILILTGFKSEHNVSYVDLYIVLPNNRIAAATLLVGETAFFVHTLMLNDVSVGFAVKNESLSGLLLTQNCNVKITNPNELSGLNTVVYKAVVAIQGSGAPIRTI